MQRGTAPRRTQFSSCDECRRSRVACDALSQRGNEGAANSEKSCSRCAARNRACTFKWIREAKVPPRTTPRHSTRRRGRPGRKSPDPSHNLGAPGELLSYESPAPSVCSKDDSTGVRLPSSPIRATAAQSIVSTPSVAVYSPYILNLSPIADPLSDKELQWLPVLYSEGFEAVFGSWMGRYSCPFVFGQDELADRYVGISDLCTKLDRWIAHASNGLAGHIDFENSHPESTTGREISQSLKSTIAAFSARWLPITTGRSDVMEDRTAELVDALWRHARRDMLRIINRPSYRSMLSLLLFALTPIPSGVSEEEEVDGISGQACVHAALQQIQTLRARQRNLQFSGSKVSLSQKSPATATGPGFIGTSNFMNAESTAYWAALTFDTSASLTLNCRSLLSSGLFGFESEMPWRLVKTCSKMFDETAKHWDQSSFDMTDERANQIVAAAAAWKLLAWKLTAIFKEALRDGHEESEVRRAYLAVIDCIKQFDRIYRDRLEACQRRMHFLGQQTKLRWYSLFLHYHLSILMLVDIIEVSDRYDLLADLADANTDAENAVVNTLAFGLHCTYELDLGSVPRPSAHSTDADASNATSLPVAVPLVSIDPYPHHVVAGVQLLRKAIDRDLGIGKISRESYFSLRSILEKTLSHLPQSSKSVQAARAKFSEATA